jgi:hypothetical protein
MANGIKEEGAVAIIFMWIKRIVKIGILEFLSTIGLKAVAYLIAALVGGAVIITALVAIIMAILL